MSNQKFTRQMPCERCQKANRPYRELQFLVCGSTGKYHLRTVERYVKLEERGITPHLVSLMRRIDGDTVSYSKVCCILGCGISYNPETGEYSAKRVSYEQMSIKDWNALVKDCKNLGYFI